MYILPGYIHTRAQVKLCELFLHLTIPDSYYVIWYLAFKATNVIINGLINQAPKPPRAGFPPPAFLFSNKSTANDLHQIGNGGNLSPICDRWFAWTPQANNRTRGCRWFGFLRRHSPRIFAASVQTPHYRNCFPFPCLTLGDDSMTTHPSFHK